VFRRKSFALSAAGLLAVSALLAGCTTASLKDPRDILAKVNTSLTNLKSVHFHLEAGGEFAVGVQAAATDTPVPTGTPAPSVTPSPSVSPTAASSASAAGSASASAAGSAAASATPTVTPSPTPSPTATPVPTPTDTPVASPTPTPTPVYTALPVSLSGTVADGDIDFAKKAAHVTGGMPGLPGMSGEIIVVQPFAYFRGYKETQFTQQDSSALSIDPSDQSTSLYFIQQIVGAASDKTLSPVLVGVEQEPGGPSYHIRVAVTQAALSSQLSNLVSLQEKGNGQMDLWITQGDFQLERLEFSTSDPAAGTAAIRLTLSHWNSVGAITQPAYNQVASPSA